MKFQFGGSNIWHNLISNLAGNGWLALMQIILVPVFIRLLGIKAYGLFGFYLALQAMAQMFDLGLGTTLNRELAHYSAQAERSGEVRDFVRTFELACWIVAVMAGVTILLAATFFVTRWTQTDQISVTAIRPVVFCFGALVTMQLLIRFYQGGLSGLQRQPLMNLIQIIMVTLRDGGSIVVLRWVRPTSTAFFLWQTGALMIYAVAIRMVLWWSLPPAERPARLHPGLLRSKSRFAAGLSGITLLALILTQIDKVILSRLLSLDAYGYYILATTAATGLTLLTISLFIAIFPHFSALVATGDDVSLRASYHFNSQLMSLMVMPAAGMVSLFAFDLLLLWTGNIESSKNAAPVLSVYLIGTAMNSLMLVPFAVQLAHGWTSIALRISLLQLLVFVPSVIFLSRGYGPVGAAFAWMMSSGINMIATIFLTHAQLLKGESWTGFVRNIGLPALAVLTMTLIWRQMTSEISGFLHPVAAALALFVIASAAVVLAADGLRSSIFSRLRN